MSGINQFQNDAVASQNLGHNKLVLDSQTIISQIAITPSDFAFSTITDALDSDKWVELFKKPKASRGFLTPKCDDNADKSKEATFFDSKINGQLKISNGLITIELIHGTENEKLYQKINSFDNKTVRVFLCDMNDNIIGTSPDNTKIRGFETTIFVTNRKLSDGTKPSQFSIILNLKNTTEWRDQKVVMQPMKLAEPWQIDNYDGVYDTYLTTSNVTAAGMNVKVTIDSYVDTDPSGQISSLTKDDFVLKDSTGAAKTITSATYTDNGYVIVATLATGDTINLKECASLSPVDIWIESTGAKILTVPA